MYSIPVPKLARSKGTTNDIGLTLADYQGGLSTLCGGCGHDSITAAIIQACFELSLPPHRVAKLSGIGCSSKTPGYFISQAHGFNAVHGRMPPIATGANCAERDMIYLAVSGDGDSGSIGLGHFSHIVRRNINMLYIVENNGVYGLTKGQFSATADNDSTSKSGDTNTFQPIDLAALAIQLEAAFVARSFSGNKKQLVPLIKAGLSQPGFALLDVLSPCVSFNNHKGSTKSYQHIRDYEVTPAIISDFVPVREPITADQTDDQDYDIELHDGSALRIHQVDGHHNPCDKLAALSYLHETAQEKKVPTGLLFLNPQAQEFHTTQGTSKIPLRRLEFEDLCPGTAALNSINSSLR